MKKWNTVAIIGVGLIGGSIGLALRRRGLTKNVVGIGRRASSLRKAKRNNAVTSTTTNVARGVADADLVVVCTPVQGIAEHVQTVAEACPAGALITDVGSTKGEIVSSLQGRLPPEVRYVGSHPLAGSEKTGCDYADHQLLVDRVVIITPSRGTAPSATKGIRQFWNALGARVLEMTPQEHDRALASTSHLPHLVASILAASTPEEFLRWAASGWLDTTRVAGGDAELWKQIILSNRRHVLKSLSKFEKVLASFRNALDREDSAKIAKILEDGKRNRDAVGD